MDVQPRPLPRGTIVPISGVSYRQGAVNGLEEGQAVLLRHDVTNAYDQWAVAVETLEGAALGFVPAKGGLAARLSVNAPGGTWEGTVVEVLRGETTGVRVRVGDLLELSDARPGSDRAGRRNLDDGVNEDGTLAPADPWDLGTVDVAVGPSGRVLGIVLEAGDLVRVRAANGAVRAYPRQAVRIRAENAAS